MEEEYLAHSQQADGASGTDPDSLEFEMEKIMPSEAKITSFFNS